MHEAHECDTFYFTYGTTAVLCMHLCIHLLFSIPEFANEDVKSSGHIFYAVNDHETSWGLNQDCSLLDSYNLDDSLPSLLDNPADLLPSYTGLFDELLPIDTLINMSAKYGVFPLVESPTEASIVNKPCSSEVDMCSINSEVLEWLNPHLSEDGLPELIDFTELDSNTASLSKEPWTRKVTLVLDLDGMLLSMNDMCIFEDLIPSVENNMFVFPVQKPLSIQLWSTVMTQILLFLYSLI
jgi:hypothetical protein